ncbi:TPA: hypothetical protein TUL06_002158 [Streptococcus equi subsp. zooepidemicus]|uniref:hypothetical protein n=1 Tax=Streptococcus equi TaxID=1336 RepID=UPI000F6E9112|nr:hypothetical protein [Streptococcus equi]VED85570.1 Uncharacterised protein [Streptococcus equi subsp. equi]MCD3400943.1 hypothetical protein [Streptococcus equi subsp. zooepidemicus]MCD3413498.1 hypothetical protein [Streptococcus equi subsp. zooepidemicus]MCD3430974.1 hypothetical protein [Streptococcus equi subsp. zooepidemicus]QGM23528.1 hypothetical protein GJS33_05050 [Streptococcus equi subsp. zooepidemicus]
MSIYVKDFLEKILRDLNKDNFKVREKISQFLLDNNWFGISVNTENLSISEEAAEVLKQHLTSYLTTAPGLDNLSRLFQQKYPATHKYFQTYLAEHELDEESQFYIQDFLSYYLTRDIFLYNDSNLEMLIQQATDALTKSHGDELTSFIKWLLGKGVTRYRKTYEMTNRYTLDDKNGAYELNDYLELMYYLFNDVYIEKNNMLIQAANSKNYADTWLYLALHFICALRTTDLERLGHPQLPRDPEAVLFAIKNGTWQSTEARLTLLSLTTRLAYLKMTPNKTKRAKQVSQLKFHIPESCQVLIGTLFAICEAHYQIDNELSKNEPLIRKIADYERINRFMGEEIGSLFLERDFSSRSANKSYLQAVAMLADDVLEEKSELNIKGYFLAALARSHKGSYDEFAQTTTTYLKDAQLGQLQPEMVAKELFERGVLSMVPSMLLTIVTRGKYKELSPSQQTQMIKELDLTPAEIEKTLELSVRADSRSKKALQTVVEEGLQPNQILTVCHRIGNGEAFSKQAESMCLLSALGKLCPYDDRQHCIGCQYELQTKSTLLLLIGEFNRLNRRYSDIKNDLERGKIRSILEQQLKPCLTEMLQVLSNQYGEGVLHDYEEIIKELVS